MKDRFDLEEEIIKLYSFAEDVDDVYDYVMESEIWPVEVQDDICNMLGSIRVKLKIHAEKMFDTMKQCFKIDQYGEDLTNTDEPAITKCSDNVLSDPDPNSFEYQ